MKKQFHILQFHRYPSSHKRIIMAYCQRNFVNSVLLYLESHSRKNANGNFRLPFRGGCRGRVQGVRPPAPRPPPRDDLRFSNTTGILQKKKLCGLLEETSAPPPEKNPGSAPALPAEVSSLAWLLTISAYEVVH